MVIDLNNKNFIMFGLIIGIACFFIGAMISNVFPSSSKDLTSYKASAAIKLIGIGFLTTTLVLSGLIYYEIDKNIKFLLLFLGLIFLLIYLIGSPMLRWDISESGTSLQDYSQDESSEAYNERPTALGTPGFEFIILIVSIIVCLAYKKITSNV